MTAPSIHATAIVIGTKGLLIRGVSGSGKSSLAEMLILSAVRRGIYAGLVADDRVCLTVAHGRVIAACPATIRGKLEVRGFGIVAANHVPQAQIHLIVDLVAAEEIERLPEESFSLQCLEGGEVPGLRCPAAQPQDAIRQIRWALRVLFPGIPDYI